MEDDVVTKPGYLSTMKNFALNQKTEEWILLEFSHLGFIGLTMLFYISELTHLPGPLRIGKKQSKMPPVCW